MIIDVILLVYLAVCSYTDLRFRKVYNVAAISAVIIGTGLNCIYFGLPGLKLSAFGFLTGFSMLILFYLLGGVGAGDVKYLAAIGCIKGAKFVFIGGLYGAIIGGIAGVVVLILQKRFLRTMKDIFTRLFLMVTFKAPEALKYDAKNASYLPYTVFLSAGMLLRWAETGCFLSGLTR